VPRLPVAVSRQGSWADRGGRLIGGAQCTTCSRRPALHERPARHRSHAADPFNRFARDVACQVFGKVEFFNPGGSVKDRTGLAMVEKAEEQGLIERAFRPSSRRRPATRAWPGTGRAVKGYRCIFVLPDKMSADKIRLLKAYAPRWSSCRRTFLPTPRTVTPASRTAWRTRSRSVAADQFSNLANPEVHYLTTGPRSGADGGKVTCFVAGVGTGAPSPAWAGTSRSETRVCE